jgi:hypothetical protein
MAMQPRASACAVVTSARQWGDIAAPGEELRAMGLMKEQSKDGRLSVLPC